jgi:hypothetical protein
MQKNRQDEAIGIIKHICMKMCQGNFPCSYLKPAKMPFFFFYLLQNWKWKGRTWSEQGLGEWYHCKGVGGRERVYEDKYSANTL